jgi:hypothetical protein
MDSQATERNPFMLLLHPEAVIAAVEKSERLGRLNRHLCRPLDRPAPVSVPTSAVGDDDDLLDRSNLS